MKKFAAAAVLLATMTLTIGCGGDTSPAGNPEQPGAPDLGEPADAMPPEGMNETPTPGAQNSIPPAPGGDQAGSGGLQLPGDTDGATQNP